MTSSLLDLNLSDKVILIAEDDISSNQYFKSALSQTGATLIWKKNGKEAVDYVRSGQKIDLILMDIHMPGTNGIDATREIRTLNSEVIVVIQTAYILSGEKEKSYEAGCNAFIAKPIRLNDLKNTLKTYLRK